MYVDREADGNINHMDLTLTKTKEWQRNMMYRKEPEKNLVWIFYFCGQEPYQEITRMTIFQKSKTQLMGPKTLQKWTR